MQEARVVIPVSAVANRGMVVILQYIWVGMSILQLYAAATQCDPYHSDRKGTRDLTVL